MLRRGAGSCTSSHAERSRSKRGNKGRVHRMSGSLSHHPAEDAMASQGQVTNQVEHFVADEFVVKSKRAILHLAGARE